MLHKAAATRVRQMPGPRLTAEGCLFRLWAPNASRVQLVLVEADLSQRSVDMAVRNGLWDVFVPGVRARQRYGFRVHGEWQPEVGLRANPAKLLVDPYARAITGGVDFLGPVRDHVSRSGNEIDGRDSLGAVPLSVVVADSPPPRPIAERRPLSKSIIYELHVKGFTRLHPLVPHHLRGKYAGLAHPAVIDYLKSSGVTAVELLPIHHFVSESFVTKRGLSNYWGYSTLGFFAPHAAYCSVGTLGSQVEEFKQMVSQLHDAGIEVILDVVYNHTAEGSLKGPTISFRGIDHRGYYRLTPDRGTDYDVTGCGNSVDTSQTEVLDLVLDSMRYWVDEMGVDGFRFDLATTLVRDGQHNVDQNHAFKKAIADDPSFADIKMIAEPWDMGPFGYQVGRFGRGWSEWNDRYRGFIRDYWRGSGGVQELATRLSGSADLFDHDDRPPSSSVNFITAHDGFTMRDLVSYSHKHNQANWENNRDGSDDNRSWNCGVEGETDDEQINRLRHRQVRNMMATLLLSRGVPMITAGDEMGRTQRGNNNAYCQDNQIGWVDWHVAGQWHDVSQLTATLARIRQTSRLLSYDDYLYHVEVLDAKGESLERYNLAWMNGYSGEMNNHDWLHAGRRLLGMYLSSREEALLTWFHAGAESVPVTMPPVPWGWRYDLLATTAEPDELTVTSLAPGATIILPGRTVAVFGVKVPSDASALRLPAVPQPGRPHPRRERPTQH